jgi:hypothetical protein
MTSNSTLMQASRQWASRPSDERFTSLTDMHAVCVKSREASVERVLSTRGITAMPVQDDAEGRGLVVVGPNGAPVAPTNWAFGQLARIARVPSDYVRTIPAPLAADCLNYGLKFGQDMKDVGVLLHKNGGPAELRAVTGPNYGRIWNADFTGALVRRFGDGVTGDFRVPGEFGKAVQVTKENTTLYASDRDMFVFLADEKNRIEMPNRRDGKAGSLARGFFVWNSEVGKMSYGFAMFLFDFVCQNRIVWGAQEYTELRGRHTSSAPDRFLEEIHPAIAAFSKASEQPILRAIESAQQKKVDDVGEFLRKRFTQSQSQAMMAVHMAEEGRPIESLWDASTAVTAYARELPHQDARVQLEREAGQILDMAA